MMDDTSTISVSKDLMRRQLVPTLHQIENNLQTLDNTERCFYGQAKKLLDNMISYRIQLSAHEPLGEKINTYHQAVIKLAGSTGMAEQFGDGSMLERAVLESMESHDELKEKLAFAKIKSATYWYKG